MKKKEQTEYIDDGRTIANMNVEGMPWYNPSKRNEGEAYKPSKGESVYILFGILKAAMLIALIFAIGFLAFILFTDYIWLR